MIGFIGVVAWVAYGSLDRSEIVECKKWQSEASEYNGFYLTHWQSEQCRAHKITINAPVK